MQIFVVLTAAFFSISQTAASPVAALSALKMRASDACDPGAAVPFLRGFSTSGADHFYTTNAAELENAIASGSYTSEGVAALVFNGPVDSSIPLHRLYNVQGVDHFYTTSVPEVDSAEQGGYVYEGIAAYVYPSQICGSVPLLRGFSASGVDHFYTTSAAELENAVANDGYISEGVAAYVLPA